MKRDNDKLKAYYTHVAEERKRSFDELKKSEEKYWTVFNHNPMPMWIYDVNTLRFLLVNDAACKKYGYTRDEFYQMGINDIRPDADKNLISNCVQIASTTKHKVWHRTFTHLTKKGDELIVNIESAEIILDGRVARLVTVSDVTTKINDDKLLHEANLRLQNASDIAGIGYWSKDFKTGDIYWSDTMYKIFGQDKSTFKLTDDNIMQAVGQKEMQGFTDRYEQLLANDGVKEFEHRIQTNDGTEKWLLERLTLLKDLNGNPTVLEGIILDITERKRTEQAVQLSNERFEMVSKAAVEAIIDWDITKGEIFWGEGFKLLFGYENKSDDRTLWVKHIHNEDKYRVLRSLLLALINKDQAFYFEHFRYMRANGETAYVEHRGVFTRDANGKATRAVGAMIDVTHLREKMNTIKEQNEQLRSIAWMQSHIVRAPLANIIGLTSLVKDYSENSNIPSEILHGLEDNAQKLDTVIRDIVKKTERLYSIDAL